MGNKFAYAYWRRMMLARPDVDVWYPLNTFTTDAQYLAYWERCTATR